MNYFSDYFNVDHDVLEEYGAFDISLINDLPLFIDPFLLFGSQKEEYQALHKSILAYLTFLRDKSARGSLTQGEISAWYSFSEVKQNWLGYSLVGNSGSGLGQKFGKAMSSHMHIIFGDINNEKIATSSHLEKAGLFQIGVGRDNISDFTCNLIKNYLLEYTETFARENLEASKVKKCKVQKAYFDYTLERWMPRDFMLPFHKNDFILLTPKDILTREENWINGKELRSGFHGICQSIPNHQLRAEINNYFRSRLPKPAPKKKITQAEISRALDETLLKFPQIIDYYIKQKEDDPTGAVSLSEEQVKEVEAMFIENIRLLMQRLVTETDFFDTPTNSYEEALKRINFLKQVIESNDGYRLFYVDGKPIKREADLQVIYRLTWFGSPMDVNREVNNGRGPVDYTVSRGSKDKTLVEFKLASNSQLERNLKNQVKIYEEANNTSRSIKVILYFSKAELLNVKSVLKRLKLDTDQNIILIDAGKDKPSASKV